MTHASGKEQLFDYVEVFCDQQWIHTAIGFVSPVEWVRRYLAK